MSKQVVGFGEIMMRLSPPPYQRLTQASSLEVHYGGGEANVICSLAYMGLPTGFVTRLPDNDLGRAVLQHLNQFQVETTHIIKGGSRLGTYFLEHGAVARGAKVIYDRAESSAATIQPGMVDWDKAFDGAYWFHFSGITPAISKSAAETCQEAIEAARHKGLTVSCDLNYRGNLWQYGTQPDQVMPELVKGCDILLADLYSAKVMLGIEGPMQFEDEEATRQGYLQLFEKLKEHYPRLRRIASTHRRSVNASQNGYTAYLYDGEKLIKGAEHNITHIVDRIGAGDAFMAGLIYGYSCFDDEDQRAVDFALAAAALKHTIPGDFNRASPEEIENVMGDSSGRVAR